MKIDPYLFFDGRCEEAIAFYESALGAELQMKMRYSDSPEPTPPGMLPPGSENKIMHASMLVKGAVLMLADGHCGGNPKFEGFSLSLACESPEEAHRCFDALAQGGKITMPLGKTFWAALFGMVTDKFGVGWMIGLNDH